MKKGLFILTMVVMASCSNEPKTTVTTSNVDSSTMCCDSTSAIIDSTSVVDSISK